MTSPVPVSSETFFQESIIIPYFIKKALVRNKLDTIDVLNSEKMSKILSRSDMLLFDYLNISSSCFYNRYQVLNKVFALPYGSEVGLSDETAVDDITRMMTPVNRDPDSVEYEVQVLKEGKIAVILNPGFFDVLTDRDKFKAFVSEYLKALYSLSSIADVSSRNIFSVYFGLL